MNGYEAFVIAAAVLGYLVGIVRRDAMMDKINKGQQERGDYWHAQYVKLLWQLDGYRTGDY